MREGSLEAPTRHPIDWNGPAYTDPDQIDRELRRVFDICHGCRRCFNLCDTFPKLFDLIDESESGELDTVDSKDFKPVVDACTLCDMCFMTKCPYVPPHEFNLDFPHLMLRYRAAELARGEGAGFAARQLTQTDRNGKPAGIAPGLANWASDTSNGLTRPVMERTADIHREASVPKFHGKTFARAAKSEPAEVNRSAPAYGRKAVLYATCFVNYNNPKIGLAARAVLAKIGGDTAAGRPEEDVDRTSAAGKASSVQFIHFPLGNAQAEAVKSVGTRIVLGFTHPSYSHMVVLPEDARAALAEDLD